MQNWSLQSVEVFHNSVQPAALNFIQGEDTMKWQGRRTSTNVEDRRGLATKGIIGGGIGGGILTLVIMLIVTFCGGNPAQVPNSTQLTNTNSGVSSTYQETQEE